MRYDINLTFLSKKDIIDIHDYIFDYDSPLAAKRLYEKIQELISSLNYLPQRGHIPPELESIRVYDYLEVHYKPYRIIYQIIEKKVIIHGVFDGRRQMQKLLEERLLRP